MCLLQRLKLFVTTTSKKTMLRYGRSHFTLIEFALSDGERQAADICCHASLFGAILAVSLAWNLKDRRVPSHQEDVKVSRCCCSPCPDEDNRQTLWSNQLRQMLWEGGQFPALLVDLFQGVQEAPLDHAISS